MPYIARLEIQTFRYRLKAPMKTVFGLVESRPALLLRIEDSEGAEGFGEIWCNFPQPGAEYRANLAAAVLPSALAGLSSDAPAEGWRVVREKLHRLALQAGEPGPADQIACGLDIALHDLAARRAGVALATHLGGNPRPLKAYASGIDCRDADAMMAAARAQGHSAFKLRVGFGRDVDLAAVKAAATGLHAAEKLMIDANQAWDEAAALDRVRALAGEKLAWIEEPLAADRPPGEWRAVARAASARLAGGENLRSDAEFDAAIAGDWLGVIQPDICKWGGLSACQPLARRIAASGKLYCPHYLGGGVGLSASAHLLAAVGGDGLLEIDVNDNALREAFAGPLLPLRDGLAHVPDGPGLGYRPDFAAAAEMRVQAFDLKIQAG